MHIMSVEGKGKEGEVCILFTLDELLRLREALEGEIEHIYVADVGPRAKRAAAAEVWRWVDTLDRIIDDMTRLEDDDDDDADWEIPF